MINRFLPLFLLHFFVLGVSAQPTIEWQRAYGGTELDEAYAAQQTPDGGYIVAGFAISKNGDVTGHHGAVDAWVIKFDALGAVSWKRAYGGSSLDLAYALENTSDGGYIMAGYAESNNGNVSGNHGGSDAWVVKLSTNGAIQWQKCLGGTGWDEAWDVKQTADGGYVVVGRTNSTNGDAAGTNGGLDYWIVKLTEDGDITWQKNYGGSKEDNAYGVIQTSDGGYVVVGEAISTDGDVTSSRGNGDYWVLKLDASGALLWERALGGSFLDRANDVVETADGGYLVVGSISSIDGDITDADGGYDIWVVKLDATGVLQWQKPYGGADEDRGESIRRTIAGNYIIGGSTQSTDGDVQNNDGLLDQWILEINESGEINWETTIGGSFGEISFFVAPTSDGGCFSVGSSYSSNGDVTGQHGPAGYSDYWVVKLSPASVSTTQPATPTLTLTPNPAGASVILNFPDAYTASEVVLHDLLGREVLRENMTGNELNISRLTPGVYQVSATSVDGKRAVGKLIKQ